MLITGAGGQLGRSLLRHLSSMRTTALERSRLDITDRSAVREAVAAIKPAVIINVAAYNKVDEAEREPLAAIAVNKDGVAWLAEAAHDADASLLHFSTDYVFDGTKGAPYSESDTPNPISRYGESKLAGEAAVVESSARHLIVRTSWLFSEFPGNFVTRILALVQERDMLDMVDDQVGSPTYAGFVAETVARLIAHPSKLFGVGEGNILHVCNAEWASRFEVAERVVAVCRDRCASSRLAALRRVTTAQYPLPARRPPDSRLAVDRLRREFAISPPDWRRAIDDVVLQAIKALRYA